jgi:uncharacterized protein (TIGR00299 family) protein
VKIAYFDCFSGISGDMTVAAFLDAGLPLSVLKDGLDKLGVGGYEIARRKVRRGAISGIQFECRRSKVGAHGHRTLKDIRSIIGRSALSRRVKETSGKIFDNIASAEAKVHGCRGTKSVYLHELGDIDSIVDIVGSSIAMEAMGIDEARSSPVMMGRTIARTAHGAIPIPAPAAIEMLKGVPVQMSTAEAELVTPTGAGILKTVVSGFGPMPPMEISSIGYGAGSREIEGLPNMLRVVLGESRAPAGLSRVKVVEANIDDMNPQYFEYAEERLFDAGALDVYVTPIQMKRSRPAFKLTAICREPDLKDVSDTIFRETTTIGVRFYDAGRYELDRKIEKARTGFGAVRVKVSRGSNGMRTVSPEYRDCRRIAAARGVPLKTVYDAARSAVR